jgi:hypothetical protein
MTGPEACNRWQDWMDSSFYFPDHLTGDHTVSPRRSSGINSMHLIENLGCSVVTITPNTPTTLARFATRQSLKFRTLSDPK